MGIIFALDDCNNFYVSCERVFNSALAEKLVVILSNKTKVLGIPMGAPYYQYRLLIEQNGGQVFSSNHQFYGDMPECVMASLRMMVQDLEVYSIDEAFLSLNGLAFSDPLALAVGVRAKMLKWTGIPISLGLAPTSTLAEIANSEARNMAPERTFEMRDSSV